MSEVCLPLSSIATPQPIYDLNAKALEALLTHLPPDNSRTLDCSADLEMFLTSQNILTSRVRILEKLLDDLQVKINQGVLCNPPIDSTQILREVFTAIVEHNQQP